MKPNHYQLKLARILRVDHNRLMQLEADLEKATGKTGVLEKVIQNNETRVVSRLKELGLERSASANDVYTRLIAKIESDDRSLADYINIKKLKGQHAAQKVVDFVQKIHPPQRGYFLKKEKAKELLIAEPPKNIRK